MTDSPDRGIRPASGPDGSRGDRSGPKKVGPRASTPSRDTGAARRPGSPRANSPASHDRSAGNPFGARPASDRGGRDRDLEDRDPYGIKSVRGRHDDPIIPDDVKAADLDRVARTQLKTLSKENAEEVARHMAMAARLIEDDPQLAHRHATSAARRAGRIAVVRETLAITAYATGDFALALRELRTYRRISGKSDQLPLMVDSERGLGRADRALELGRSVDRTTLPIDVQVQLAIAMSGARLDLDQPEVALIELEIAQLDPDRAFSWSPDLFDAYATVLEELGRDADAAIWFARSERASLALGGDDARADESVEIFEEELPDVSTPADLAPRGQGTEELRAADRDGSDRDGSDRDASPLAVDEDTP